MSKEETIFDMYISQIQTMAKKSRAVHEEPPIPPMPTSILAERNIT
jgi:hypothetical protein